jgi:hypothetical protein
LGEICNDGCKLIFEWEERGDIQPIPYCLQDGMIFNLYVAVKDDFAREDE